MIGTDPNGSRQVLTKFMEPPRFLQVLNRLYLSHLFLIGQIMSLRILRIYQEPIGQVKNSKNLSRPNKTGQSCQDLSNCGGTHHSLFGPLSNNKDLSGSIKTLNDINIKECNRIKQNQPGYIRIQKHRSGIVRTHQDL